MTRVEELRARAEAAGDLLREQADRLDRALGAAHARLLRLHLMTPEAAAEAFRAVAALAVKELRHAIDDGRPCPDVGPEDYRRLVLKAAFGDDIHALLGDLRG